MRKNAYSAVQGEMTRSPSHALLNLKPIKILQQSHD